LKIQEKVALFVYMYMCWLLKGIASSHLERWMCIYKWVIYVEEMWN